MFEKGKCVCSGQIVKVLIARSPNVCPSVLVCYTALHSLSCIILAFYYSANYVCSQTQSLKRVHLDVYILLQGHVDLTYSMQVSAN